MQTESLACELSGRAQGAANESFRKHKKYTMVFPTAKVSGCTMRIIGFEMTYTGSCRVSLIAWQFTGSETYVNRFEASSVTLSKVKQATLKQVYFTKSSDKVVIKADETRYFGMEQKDDKCEMLGQTTSSDALKTYYSKKEMAPGDGKSAKMDKSESVMVSFRVYLEG